MSSAAEQVTGLVVVDKEAGWTSHDVVARCRRIFGQRRVGHAGTLDFTQDSEGLKVKMPQDRPCDFVFALKITGLDVRQTLVDYSAPDAPASKRGPAPAGPTELLSQ